MSESTNYSVTANNDYMDSLAQTLYECNDDFVIREQCRAREEDLREKNYYKSTIAKQGQMLQEKDAILQEKDAEIMRLKALLAEHNTL